LNKILINFYHFENSLNYYPNNRIHFKVFEFPKNIPSFKYTFIFLFGWSIIIEEVPIENPALLIYIFEGEENETRREREEASRRVTTSLTCLFSICLNFDFLFKDVYNISLIIMLV